MTIKTWTFEDEDTRNSIKVDCENKSVTLFWGYKPYRAHITDRQGGVIEWSFSDYLIPEKDSRLGNVDAMVRKEVVAFVKRELQNSKSKKSNR